jgi:hypothetical protein
VNGPADALRLVEEPTVTTRLDPVSEADEHGLARDEVSDAEDAVRWDLHMGASITVARDVGPDGEPGLMSVTLGTGPDLPRSGIVRKAVTPDMVRRYAGHLVRLAERQERGEAPARSVTIAPPSVPFPGSTTDAQFYRRAARNIRNGYWVGGSNATETMAAALDVIASALDGQAPGGQE